MPDRAVHFFNMDCRSIIHAVGPCWQGGGSNEDELLYKTYKSIFDLIKEKEIKSIALPAISTGIFGFPLQRATQIAHKAVSEFLMESPDTQISLYCFDDTALACYRAVFEDQAGAG